jgi:ABC-2 type transport system ATP-binding protein
MTQPAIEISELQYFYRHQWSGKKIRALFPFSLKIEPGECFGFLGHNGAGKTTTIKALLGLIRPSAGSISLFGKKSTETASRHSVGYVPEQPYFYDHLSVQEIVEMYAALSGLVSKNRRVMVRNALEKLGLYDRRNTPMRSLSKGLTQRVAVAQAICHNPKLLVLDEPFSGLDPIGRKELRDLFAQLQKQGTTIFMSSHILPDVESLCNRVSIMVKGELKGVFNIREGDLAASSGFEITFHSPNSVSEETMRELGGKQLSHPTSLRLLFKERKEAENALKIANEHGLILDKFESAHGSLEDLFVALVNENQRVLKHE